MRWWWRRAVLQRLAGGAAAVVVDTGAKDSWNVLAFQQSAAGFSPNALHVRGEGSLLLLMMSAEAA